MYDYKQLTYDRCGSPIDVNHFSCNHPDVVENPYRYNDHQWVYANQMIVHTNDPLPVLTQTDVTKLITTNRILAAISRRGDPGMARKYAGGKM